MLPPKDYNPNYNVPLCAVVFVQIILAAQQGSTPRTAIQMLPYLGLMQSMARDMNITIPGVIGQSHHFQFLFKPLKKLVSFLCFFLLFYENLTLLRISGHVMPLVWTLASNLLAYLFRGLINVLELFTSL